MRVLGLALLALMLGSSPGTAAPQCDISERVIALLADQYGESVVAIGIAGKDGNLTQVFVNPETRTWTIAYDVGDGNLCLLATGIDWEFLVEQ